MKRFFAKVGRFFWSWGFLKFIMWTITAIVLLYVEENWRGARDWAATKAAWEEKGESFDPNKFIPPLVPDEQNLAALPLFKQEMEEGEDGRSYLAEVALRKAMRRGLPGGKLSYAGNWLKGGWPDMAKIKSTLAANHADAFPKTTPPTAALDQFNALYPFVDELHAAAVTRTQFRLVADYSISPPVQRPFGPLVEQVALSQSLKVHAMLALDQHQPDLALADIKLNLQIVSGVKQDPTLVAGLVAVGMNAIFNSVISYGLALHAWSDAQLAELESSLAEVDFLSSYQFTMRGEMVTEGIPNIDYLKAKGLSGIRTFVAKEKDPPPGEWGSGLPSLWASGWLDQNKRQMVNRILTSVHLVDPMSHRVFPDLVDEQQTDAMRDKARVDALAPWNLFVSIAGGTLLSAITKFTQAQVYIDEARIACALERYRLAHQVYPDSLDELAPAYIPEVPCDVINGEAYCYKLQPDGAYLLYSIGWNRVDDGGKVGYQKDSSTALDYKQGDLVWPMLKPEPAK